MLLTSSALPARKITCSVYGNIIKS
jgi:hypothetical protein